MDQSQEIKTIIIEKLNKQQKLQYYELLAQHETKFTKNCKHGTYVATIELIDNINKHSESQSDLQKVQNGSRLSIKQSNSAEKGISDFGGDQKKRKQSIEFKKQDKNQIKQKDQTNRAKINKNKEMKQQYDQKKIQNLINKDKNQISSQQNNQNKLKNNNIDKFQEDNDVLDKPNSKKYIVNNKQNYQSIQNIQKKNVDKNNKSIEIQDDNNIRNKSMEKIRQNNTPNITQREFQNSKINIKKELKKSNEKNKILNKNYNNIDKNQQDVSFDSSTSQNSNKKLKNTIQKLNMQNQIEYDNNQRENSQDKTLKPKNNQKSGQEDIKKKKENSSKSPNQKMIRQSIRIGEMFKKQQSPVSNVKNNLKENRNQKQEMEEQTNNNNYEQNQNGRILELYEKYYNYLQDIVPQEDLMKYYIDEQNENISDLKIVIFAIFDKFYKLYLEEVSSEKELREINLQEYIYRFINEINKNNVEKTVQQIFQILHLTDLNYFQDKSIFLFKSIILNHYSYKQISFLMLVINKVNQLFFGGDLNQMIFNLWMNVNQQMFEDIISDIFHDQPTVKAIFKKKLINYSNLKLDELIYRLLSIFINEIDKSKINSSPNHLQSNNKSDNQNYIKKLKSQSVVMNQNFSEKLIMQQQIESEFYTMLKQIYQQSQNYNKNNLEKLFLNLKEILNNIVEGIINQNKLKYFNSLKIKQPNLDQIDYCELLQQNFRKLQHSGYMQLIMTEFIQKLLSIQEFQDIVIMEVINCK